MSETLFALQDDDGTIFCAECADKRYGETYPESTTPIFESDGWRGEIKGICGDCNKMVDGMRPVGVV